MYVIDLLVHFSPTIVSPLLLFLTSYCFSPTIVSHLLLFLTSYCFSPTIVSTVGGGASHRPLLWGAPWQAERYAGGGQDLPTSSQTGNLPDMSYLGPYYTEIYRTWRSQWCAGNHRGLMLKWQKNTKFPGGHLGFLSGISKSILSKLRTHI